MDKISDLKKIIIQTLDINKARDIVSIDLKDKFYGRLQIIARAHLLDTFNFV